MPGWRNSARTWKPCSAESCFSPGTHRKGGKRVSHSVKQRSIFTRLLIPLLVIVLLTIIILVGALTLSGAFSELEQNALDMLEERTASKAETLQTDMLGRWTNLNATAESVARIVNTHLAKEQATLEDMKTNAALNADIMQDVAPLLLNRLRAGGTTGIFVVLNGIGVADQPETWAGVYLRDADPTTNSSTNNDVLLYRGLPPVGRALDIPLDSYWRASFTFDQLSRETVLRPMGLAQDNTGWDAAHYGGWSMPFTLGADSNQLGLVYSMPILDGKGNVLGIVGVDMSITYLEHMLYSYEHTKDMAISYVLGMQQTDGSISVACASGNCYKQSFNGEDVLIAPDSIEKNDKDNCLKLELTGTRSGKRLFASAVPMALYDDSDAYAGDRWVLVGMQTEETLLAFSEQFQDTVFMAVVMAIACSLVVATIASRDMVKPITRLTREVESAEPGEELHLSTTNILEMQTLSDAMVNMNHNAITNAARLSAIVHMTGMRMGVFEVKAQDDTVYCSPGLFELLDCHDLACSGEQMTREAFGQLMRASFDQPYDEDVWVVRRGGQKLYLRYRQHESDNTVMGTLLDVTEEINTRIDLEHARDIDALTGILNRRAFNRIVQDLLGRHRDSLGVTAMVMVDLDNLKFLNTTYGLDTGDSFITGFAHALGAFEKDGQSVIARRSGDEFYMLLYGFSSREELVEHINNAWKQVSAQGIVLPDGSFYRFRASGGMALLHDDADTVSELLHYADFALYTVKRDAKGSLRQFDSKLFSAEAYMIEARAALDSLIDSQLLHFAFQPIVSVKDADIFGYELLMRPDVPELKSPMAVLRLAKEQGKLHHIERLTWFCGMKSARRYMERGMIEKHHKLFINSIASQKMDRMERQHIIDNYTDMLPQVVLELTESEDNNQDFTERKMDFIRGNGGEVAIDDYGTGYNSELALVHFPCEYVKLDASFVRNVDKDTNKQALVKNLMSYARTRGIAILAEGVETRAEMETMIAYGVDYLQGFYLGMPREKPQQLLNSIRMEIREMAKNRQKS